MQQRAIQGGRERKSFLDSLCGLHELLKRGAACFAGHVPL
jgi:hypothetical protein